MTERSAHQSTLPWALFSQPPPPFSSQDLCGPSPSPHFLPCAPGCCWPLQFIFLWSQALSQGLRLLRPGPSPWMATQQDLLPSCVSLHLSLPRTMGLTGACPTAFTFCSGHDKQFKLDKQINKC